jgi:hypothetical protein
MTLNNLLRIGQLKEHASTPVYTQNFNRRHNKVRRLFQGRFKEILGYRTPALCSMVEQNHLQSQLHLLDAPRAAVARLALMTQAQYAHSSGRLD